MYVYSHNLFLVNICTYAQGYVLQVCLLGFSVYVKSVEMKVTSAAEREGVLIEVRGSQLRRPWFVCQSHYTSIGKHWITKSFGTVACFTFMSTAIASRYLNLVGGWRRKRNASKLPFLFSYFVYSRLISAVHDFSHLRLNSVCWYGYCFWCRAFITSGFYKHTIKL